MEKWRAKTNKLDFDHRYNIYFIFYLYNIYIYINIEFIYVFAVYTVCVHVFRMFRDR